MSQSDEQRNRRGLEGLKVCIGVDGLVCGVLWTGINGTTDQDVSARVVASVADAIHNSAQVVALLSSSKKQLPERAFVIVEHQSGRECIAFNNLPLSVRNLADIASLDN